MSEPTERRRYRSGMNKRPKRISKKKIIILGICGFLVAALLGVSLYAAALYHSSKVWNKSTMFVPESEGVAEELQKDPKYHFNEDIINVLLLGIDNKGHGSEQFNGQCDAIALFSMNTQTGEMNIISIPRETMSQIVRKDELGNFYDEQHAQLALAHSYGKDDQDSLELCKRAVSQLLYGIPIHKAVQFQVGGVPSANDLVGGVTLQVLESIPTGLGLEEGAVLTLNGEQAYDYVQYRDIQKENSSTGRLKRQVQYFKAYFQAVKDLSKETPLFLMTAHKELKNFFYTDMNNKEMLYFASQAIQTGLDANTIYSLEGEMKMGEKYAEFYPEEEALRQMVLEVYFEQR